MINVYQLSKAGTALEAAEHPRPDDAHGECSICLFPMDGKRKIVKTICHSPHLFHAACLNEWASASIHTRYIVNCPICRCDIKPLTTALEHIDETMQPEQKSQAAKVMFDDGKTALEGARVSREHYSPIAVHCLAFAFENGINEAKPFLAEAKLLLGKMHLQYARRVGGTGCIQPAIDCLLFAFENGVAEAKPLLAEANFLLGKMHLQYARKPGGAGDIQLATDCLSFAYENGVAEAKPLLAEAKLLLGKMRLKNLRLLGRSYIQPTIDCLLFALENGFPEAQMYLDQARSL